MAVAPLPAVVSSCYQVLVELPVSLAAAHQEQPELPRRSRNKSAQQDTLSMDGGEEFGRRKTYSGDYRPE